jgi:1,2-diacylglycerol 3-beta-glucosyltransferase
MQENSWQEKDSCYNELEDINSLLEDLSESAEDLTKDIFKDIFVGQTGRRRKAALALLLVWLAVISLHLVSWGFWVVMGFAALLWGQAGRIMTAQPITTPSIANQSITANLDSPLEILPRVSLLVAAKNEEAVIDRLVRALCNQNYPSDRLEVWIIDDDSSDRTPQVLAQLQQEFPQLRTVRRPAGATGGKSGALNQILAKTKGEIIAVFDADATVALDLVRQVVPLFATEKIGAVQIRKDIVNWADNFWTRGQKSEMALDSYFQQQRIALGGTGELRGNGQFVRRIALQRCGGWNEQTITDDLDLTIRLHLDNWDIGFLLTPAVGEEGVTTMKALWHQRNRWAEGGYQRYLDYWRLLASNQMGWQKTIDLISFMVMQYLLPAAAIPDLIMAVVLGKPPLLGPLTAVTIVLPLVGIVTGLRRINAQQHPRRDITIDSKINKAINASGDDALGTNLGTNKETSEDLSIPSLGSLIRQSLWGIIYLFHWVPIMASVTARMSVRPKRLKWVKTVHSGGV